VVRVHVDEIAGFRRRHRSIVDLGLLATQEGSVDRLFEEAVRLVREGLDADAAKILERRPGGALLVRAGVGWPPGVVGEVEIPPGAESQASYALQVAEPVIVKDLSTEDRFTPFPKFLEIGIRSGVNVIINGKRDPYGVLEVDHFDQREFSADDIAFLWSAANLLSVALDRQQYEEERDHVMDVTAHELRSPLTVVLGRSQRLLNRVTEESATREELIADLTDIITEGNRVQRLLKMLLELGRAERAMGLSARDLELCEAVDAAIEYAGQLHSGIEFKRAFPDEPIVIHADRDLAQIVLGNIVENAAKYSTLEPEVSVSIARTEGGAEVRVRDRCGGMNGEVLDRMFDRYFRGHTANEFRGFGLGLFVSHRASELLEWNIDVANYPGEACEFILSIPTRTDGDSGQR